MLQYNSAIILMQEKSSDYRIWYSNMLLQVLASLYSNPSFSYSISTSSETNNLGHNRFNCYTSSCLLGYTEYSFVTRPFYRLIINLINKIFIFAYIVSFLFQHCLIGVLVLTLRARCKHFFRRSFLWPIC